MSVRPYLRSDLPEARRIWDELGGWYRETLPVAPAEVDRALRSLGTRSSRAPMRRRRSGAAAWVLEDHGRTNAWIYARIEPEHNYLVPLVPPGAGESARLTELVDAAQAWFLERSVRSFLVEVPTGRAAPRAVFSARGRLRWTRSIFYRGLNEADRVAASSSLIRPFRRSDLSGVRRLAESRRPPPQPPPVPVPFLELRPAWWRGATTEPERGIWVAAPPTELLGVVGATHPLGTQVGFLGPCLLSPAVQSDAGTALLGTALAWLRNRGVNRVRTTLPTPLPDEARPLAMAGFAPQAEGELFEVRV